MGILSFLNRKGEPEPAPRPAVGAKSVAAKPAGMPAPVQDASLLCREEILDSKNRLCGYRFSLNSGNARLPRPDVDFFAALVEANIPAFAERRLAVAPVTLDTLFFKRHLAMVTPNTAFLIERGHGPADQLIGRLLAIREEGSKVALTGWSPEPASEFDILAAVDILFLKLGDGSLAEFQALTRQLRSQFPKLELAVEDVHSWDEQRMCLAWGCTYCLGEFVSKPDREDPDAKIDQSRLTAIEMLNLLRNDAELPELATVAKRDPGITFQLLKWANAPSNGQSTTITSLAQAILVLGRSHLYRWLTVSMFRVGGKHKERDEALLEVALTRARFLELVSASTLNQAERDEMFLVGLLSLFDVLLGMPMAKILSTMHLSDKVSDVLMRSDGPYGKYLMLALQLERGMVGRATEIATSIGVDPDSLTATSAAAFAWAQESLRHTLGEE